jgi:uncharacterized protein
MTGAVEMTEPERAEPTPSEVGQRLRGAARFGDSNDVASSLAWARDANKLTAVLSAADNLSGNTALHMCAANGHFDVLRDLLAAGASPSAVNLAGSTALHYAAVGGAVECVEALLRAGGEVLAFSENNSGMTPFDEAQKSAGGEVARLLKEYCDTTASMLDAPEEMAPIGQVEEKAEGTRAVEDICAGAGDAGNVDGNSEKTEAARTGNS